MHMKTHTFTILATAFFATLLIVGCSRNPLTGTWHADSGETISFQKDGTFTRTLPPTDKHKDIVITGKYERYVTKDSNHTAYLNLATVSDSRNPGIICSGGLLSVSQYSVTARELVIGDNNSGATKYHRDPK